MESESVVLPAAQRNASRDADRIDGGAIVYLAVQFNIDYALPSAPYLVYLSPKRSRRMPLIIVDADRSLINTVRRRSPCGVWCMYRPYFAPRFPRPFGSGGGASVERTRSDSALTAFMGRGPPSIRK